ncbi:MAG: alpha-glucosidase [Leptolyngbyaceae cyanobacterium SM2_3_12]|nr:alpha-glucosidase [Leptolyngbyaceae cyanobacterium SM2_3_12]
MSESIPEISSPPWWRVPILPLGDPQEDDKEPELQNQAWWRNAVIYQISPWSFLDTSGDGKGDLRGIVHRLDYISSLGVDAIWLTPIYESPMDDLGYDITDMRAVGDEFGTLEDFQHLLEIAHGMKLNVIIDQVWNHTSSQHPWFQESRSSRDNPKADWYVWADAKADGSPPNNWLSSLAGRSSWKWDAQREQYYLFNFLESQPDLNWYNDDVIEAILKRAKFWLDLGVDGFRVDAVNYFLHDHQLRDNPPRPDGAPWPDGLDQENPLSSQMLTYSFNRPETPKRLRPIRELVDQYPGVVTLGEVTLCEDSIQLASQYVQGSNRLHLAYHSGLLIDQPLTADLMAQQLQKGMDNFKDWGGCWIVGNHDYGRLRCRWTGKDEEGNLYPEAFYRMTAALLICMPGAFCLWQGDELGLPVAEIPSDIALDEIKDPFGQALYPEVEGRDGSRTPMPWTSQAPCGGFTTAKEPWLPIPDSHLERSVEHQHPDANSLLNTWRRLLHWRKDQPALAAGQLQGLTVEGTLLVFQRTMAAQSLLCVFNLSDQSAAYDLKSYGSCQAVRHLGYDFSLEGHRVELPSYGVFLGQISP